MGNLALSPLAPILGRRVPLRGTARLLFRSYAKKKSSCQPSESAQRTTTKSKDEFDVVLSSFLEWQLWAFGAYEEHFAELFRYLVRPGDRCIDVGANVGVHTTRLAKLVGAHGEVIAIEADAELAHRANNNILLNHLTNVRLIQAAASDRAGDTVSLYRPNSWDTNRARASLLPHPYLTGSANQVRTVTIDNLTHGPVGLIKIDVEGHEEGVVLGAARTISEHSPSIIFEYIPELLPRDSLSPFGWLSCRGYHLFDIQRYRHCVTGRSQLKLNALHELPGRGTNILAVSKPMVSRIRQVVG